MFKKLLSYLIAVVFLSVSLYSCKNKTTTNTGTKNNDPYVIMLSLDGFRWDYTSKGKTPNFDLIAKEGVKAESVRPCFPTKTFPNHYSIATGLYPDNHGIVLNNFYDSTLDEVYYPGNKKAVKNPDFYDGEPIWVTAENQGVITASYFWIGSEAPIMGVLPTYVKSYDHNFPYSHRADSVISWLKLPEKKRPHLIMWYLDEPDSRGHSTGPNSPELVPVIEYLDSLIGDFMNKLAQLDIGEKINFIVTSDHGMGTISPTKVVRLSDHIDISYIDRINGSNPVFCLEISDEYESEVESKLAKIENISLWKHGRLPDRLHYGKNPRTADIVVAADSGWSVTIDSEPERYYGGTHGYDNDNKDMHAIFYAQGPALKTNYKHPTFNNIDIYLLIAKILKIKPAEVDGNIQNVMDMLKKN